jgi:hypothetical protein
MVVLSFRRPESATPEPASVQAVAGSFLQVGDLVEPIASGLRETVKRQRLPIEQAWVQFLSQYEWQWFATFTFKDETHPEAASKRYRFWIKLLNDSNGFKSNRKTTHKRAAIWVRGLEWQKRNVVHFHCLIGNLPYELTSRAQRDLWEQAWLLMGNTGFARIATVSEIGGVSGYVSKYCAKDGEIDISSNLPNPEPDLSGTTSAA